MSSSFPDHDEPFPDGHATASVATGPGARHARTWPCLEKLTERIRLIVGAYYVSEVAELVDMNPETVRRYIRGAAPSAQFLMRLANACDVSSDWLLRGVGPRHRSNALGHTLRDVSDAELVAELRRRLDEQELEPVARAGVARDLIDAG
jgi:transcriptional regulator with XRE-family HTH domain